MLSHGGQPIGNGHVSRKMKQQMETMLHGGANIGVNMSMGTKIYEGPDRLRMPWTVAAERVPFTLLSRRNQAILDGTELYKGLGRVDQLEPLAALKAIAARRDFMTSNGYTLFQLATHLKYNGRGQRFYRKDWRDGTMDKWVTLCRIVHEREMVNGGTAWGYMSFHGETTTVPVEIKLADVPGWRVDFDEKNAVPESEIVPPPPSEGTEVPVDPQRYKLKAYPYYDAPNPAEWVERQLKAQGVIPDLPVGEADGEDATPSGTEDDGDGTEHRAAQ